MVLEDVASGWVGAVTRVEKSGGVHLVELENRRGVRRSFPLGPGFWLEGRPIEALPPRPAPTQASSSVQVSASGRRITNSGSFAPASSGPKVAKRSRIWVEGRHDAELVQHVWGEDLAEAGIAVQLLEGVDNLEAVLERGPSPSGGRMPSSSSGIPSLTSGRPSSLLAWAYRNGRIFLAISTSSTGRLMRLDGPTLTSATLRWGGRRFCPPCVRTAILNPRYSAGLSNSSTS